MTLFYKKIYQVFIWNHQIKENTGIGLRIRIIRLLMKNTFWANKHVQIRFFFSLLLNTSYNILFH